MQAIFKECLVSLWYGYSFALCHQEQHQERKRLWKLQKSLRVFTTGVSSFTEMTFRCADSASDLSEAVSWWFWNVWLEDASFALLPLTQEWSVLLWAGETALKLPAPTIRPLVHGVAVLSLEPLGWWTKQAAPHLHLLCGLPCKAAPPWTWGVHCYPSVQPPPCLPALPSPSEMGWWLPEPFPCAVAFPHGKNLLMLLWLLTVVRRNESSCRGKRLIPSGGEGTLQKIGCKSRATETHLWRKLMQKCWFWFAETTSEALKSLSS